MFEPARVLQPLVDAEPAIRKLTEYTEPRELADAVTRVESAVERTLRLMLRADPRTPDHIRLSALATAELPLDSVVEHLRQHDTITVELAGLVHELARAAERVRGGELRAADADLALRTVDVLRARVRTLGEPRRDAVSGAARHAAEPEVEPPVARPIFSRRRRVPTYNAVRAGVLAFAVLLTLILVIILIRRDSAMADGIAAFQDGRLGAAESRFREVVERDPDNVTALLYLGRIFRREQRYEEAAETLQRAAGIAPDDPAVRRELGYLFLDLRRPESAAEQFRRALAEDPENSLNWVGIIRALRAAGDPAAEDFLRRAPPDVHARFPHDSV